jgi:hypothetical protein
MSQMPGKSAETINRHCCYTIACFGNNAWATSPKKTDSMASAASPSAKMRWTKDRLSRSSANIPTPKHKQAAV